jgi:predicted ribosome quality control (RQC) complex YloA/Tae2 family protein
MTDNKLPSPECEALSQERARLLRACAKARARITRRHAAIRGDLLAIDEAERCAEDAQWLLADAIKAPRGTTLLTFVDPLTFEERAFPLDPAKPPREQIEAVFARSKRMKQGRVMAELRLDETERIARVLELAWVQINEAPSLEALEDAVRHAKEQAPRDFALPTPAVPGKRAKAKQERVHFRTFKATSGGRILVGKGAADNDELTVRVAKPRDLWLHVKDHAGAHVVVPLTRANQSCPPDDLIDAAHLAAHFSDARGERTVDVHYTPKRFVRKPRGSRAGAVTFDRAKVLALRFDAARLARLLASEVI